MINQCTHQHLPDSVNKNPAITSKTQLTVLSPMTEAVMARCPLNAEDELNSSSPIVINGFSELSSFSSARWGTAITKAAMSRCPINEEDEGDASRTRKQLFAENSSGPKWIDVNTLKANPSMHSLFEPLPVLLNILAERGYKHNVEESKTSGLRHTPTEDEVKAYDVRLVNLIRTENFASLEQLAESGTRVLACNRFGESTMHLVARRGSVKMIEYFLTHLDGKWMIDDFGRSPLHDAFWRPDPDQDIVRAIVNKGWELLLLKDVRGCTPLHYARKKDSTLWVRYFLEHMDEHWPYLK